MHGFGLQVSQRSAGVGHNRAELTASGFERPGTAHDADFDSGDVAGQILARIDLGGSVLFCSLCAEDALESGSFAVVES
jgi:hypothetical protein